MPIINISLTGEPNSKLSARIAEEVTSLTQVHLRKDPTITAVAVHYLDPNHWFVGGQTLAQQQMNTFFLDIKVVDGTNTKQELSSYMEAIFNSLSATLGDVHTESYALVHEVPAAAYGFGGKTQEFRFITSRLRTQAGLAVT